MGKWADFVVSGITKGPGLANITHVQIHEDYGTEFGKPQICLLYTSPSPRDRTRSRMPSSA